jgi:hypothetical protein
LASSLSELLASFQEIMRRKRTTWDENEIDWQAEDGQ